MIKIQSVKVQVINYTSILFDIHFVDAYERDSEFSIYCYDDSLLCLTSRSIYRPRKAYHGQRLMMLLQSDYSFLPGKHFAVLTYNGEPVYNISFSVTGIHAAADDLRISSLDSCSDEYVLVKHLETDERHSADWGHLSQSSGTAALRRQCLDFCRLFLLNKERQKQDLAILRRPRHHVLITDHSETVHVGLRSFARLIAHCSTSICNVTSLVSENYTADPLQKAKETFEATDHLYLLHHVEALLTEKGSQVAHMMEEALLSTPSLSVFFIGSEQVIRQLQAQYPLLLSLVPKENHLQLDDITLHQAIHAIEHHLHRLDLHLSPNAFMSIQTGLTRRLEDGRIERLSYNLCEHFVERALLPRFTQRILHSAPSTDSTLVRSNDLDWRPFECQRPSLEDCMSELQTMVGLHPVKQMIADLALQEQYTALLRRKGRISTAGGNHHLIFTGNPGTGKTTVAKLIGRIFHSLGLLSKGEVIVAERSDMVGRYIGETEQKMQQLLQRSKGNVLFIDEAYTLCDTTENRKDFGYRAIECLLTRMAEKDTDLIVIIAGYERDINRLLDANQGLRGRFTHHLHFDDYSSVELLNIAEGAIRKKGLQLSFTARERLLDEIQKVVDHKQKDFSNARWAEQFAGRILPHTARRVMRTSAAHPNYLNEEFLFTIDAEDVELAAAELTPVPTQRPHIGFA